MNSVLSNSFNKTITISNFEKLAIYNEIDTNHNTIIYVASSISIIVLLTCTILCILHKYQHNKYSVIPEGFDVSSFQYSDFYPHIFENRNNPQCIISNKH